MSLPQGYEGTLCESNTNNCQPDPCHHGTCVDGIASYTCNCEAGYTGYRCENQLNECHSNPCQNGGKCVDLVNKYICQCQHGTSGERAVPTEIQNTKYLLLYSGYGHRISAKVCVIVLLFDWCSLSCTRRYQL